MYTIHCSRPNNGESSPTSTSNYRSPFTKLSPNIDCFHVILITGADLNLDNVLSLSPGWLKPYMFDGMSLHSKQKALLTVGSKGCARHDILDTFKRIWLPRYKHDADEKVARCEP